MPEQIAAEEPVWSLSTISARGGTFRTLPGQPGYVAAQAVPDPQVLVGRFVQGAGNAKAAGFDGVETHAANGYLIQKFLDATANDRTDAWGGSLENRLRFALAVFDGISEIFDPGNIGIKLNPTGGFNDVGMPLEDILETYGALIKVLVSRKVGYIQLVRFFEFSDQVIDGEKRATKMDVWETFAPLISGSTTRVFLNGNISPEKAEWLIASGIGDAVVTGRPMINNPDYYQRIQNGRALSSLDTIDPRTWYTSHTEPVPKYENLPDPHIGLTDYAFAGEE
jgi:2,4-dienoyl-CoA reductase-like NADH-dependent reductase (Old Yellow Enzyme family)